MRRCLFVVISLFLCFAAALAAQSAPTPIMPLADVHAGMHGVGRTVFNGDQPSDFQVEILGVVHNLGPRQAVILARLSGGPLAETGVMEGMSGSPVYIDGKLIGAVALGFPFAKDAIAGITPIEQMLSQVSRARAVAAAESRQPPPFSAADGSGWKIISAPPTSITATPTNVGALPPPSAPEDFDPATLPTLHTPLAFSGFTDGAIRQFLPQWEAMGLTPMLGGSLSGSGESLADLDKLGPPSDLQPGDMISVQLLRGDMAVEADGTVTDIRDGRILAFGHRFLSAGATDMPFARANVLALIAGLQSSFKLSEAGQAMGSIQEDLSQGVYGQLGVSAPMIPIHIHIHNTGQPVQDYSCEMVDQRFLSPMLVTMALYSTLDATERGVGSSTLTISGVYKLAGAAPIQSSTLYSGDMNTTAIAAATATRPAALLYGSGLSDVHLQSIDFDVASADQQRVLTVEQVWSDRRDVTPGATVHVTAILRADDGTEVAREIPLALPASLPDGPLTILVGAGDSVGASGPSPVQAAADAHDLAQLVGSINRLPRNNELYVRVARSDSSYVLDGEEFPFPPPSLARALAADPAVDGEVRSLQNSTVLDYHSDPLPYLIEGMKTIRLTVRQP